MLPELPMRFTLQPTLNECVLETL